MKKIIIAFLMAFMIMVLPCDTNAATKADVIAAINATYTVGNDTYRLPSKIIALGTEYLNNKELNSSQYDLILSCISQAVALAREAGTTDYKKLSDADKKRALNIIYSAAMAAEADLEKELSKNDIQVNDKIDSENEIQKPPATQDQITETKLPVSKEENETQKPPTTPNQKTETKLPVSKEQDSSLLSNTSGNNGIEKVNIDTSSGETNIGKLNIDIPSGEPPTRNELEQNNDNISGEYPVNNEFKELFKTADKKVNIAILFLIITIIIIFIILFLIFLLILRVKKCKILKYVLLCIISLFIVGIIVVAIGLFVFKDEIRLLIKLYYVIQ